VQVVGREGAAVFLEQEARRLHRAVAHDEQAVTTLAQIVRPPLERGTTWSKVRSCEGYGSPQYWQENRSRRNTLNRVKAGLRAAWTYSFKAMTLGSRISTDGLRT
jgi:hypothetical protein